MNQQRKVIYAERLRILEGEDLKDQVRDMQDDVISAYVAGATADGYVEDWDLDELWNALESLYGPTVSWQSLVDGDEYGPSGDLSAKDLETVLQEDVRKSYGELEDAVSAIGGEEQMRNMERFTILNVMDRKWREHLYEMDYLKEGIGLRAMAQADPLVEYQREGYDMFTGMMDGIKEESIRQLFLVRQQVMQAEQKQTGDLNDDGVVDEKDLAPDLARAESQPKQMTYSGPSADGTAEQKRVDGESGNRAQRRKAARRGRNR